jgi:hypothetical protein
VSTLFIVLAVIFFVMAVSLAIFERRMSIPRTWAIFMAISAVLAFVAIWLPIKTVGYLWAAAIMWVVTLLVVFFSRFNVRRAFTWIVIMTIVVALCFIGLVTEFPQGDGQVTSTLAPTTPTTTATPTPTIKPTSVPTPTPTSPEDYIKQDMKDNGGGDLDEEYVLNEDVKPELDNSSAGNAAYSDGKIQTPEQMVDWLSKKTDRGLAAIKEIVDKTQATEPMIVSVSNWHVLQALKDGHLTDNTGFIDGQTINVGSRDIKRGDIFLVFVNPENHKLIYFRGACANPQGFTPQLEPTPTPKPTPKPTTTPVPTVTPKPTPKPTTTPVPTVTPKPTPKPTPTLAPKSSDPSDYKKPGDGTERDSGEGTKPVVPTVTETAESSPPKVETTTAPSETIIAPGATPVPTKAPSATPTPTPVPVFPTEPTNPEPLPSSPFG